MTCEICNQKLNKSFDLGLSPLADDLKKKKRESIQLKKYPIIIYHCKNCQTLFQEKIVNKKKLFHKNYHYRPKFTKDVLTGMEDLMRQVKKIVPNRGLKKKILDIGCNDGSLLDFFKKEGFETYGIEPTNAADEAKKKHKIIKNFFSKKIAKIFLKKFGFPDIVIFTNVFAHIENINLLISALKIILKKNAILVIENHYLLSVLKKFQFDTFYHEHIRTYSLNSFFQISKKLDLNLFKYEFPKRYGGNIRVYMKKENFQKTISKKNYLRLLNEKKQINKSLFNFKKKIYTWINQKKKFFQIMNKKFGPIQGKSYPARASLIINILKLNSSNISNVFEKPGSKKIGYYIPGTDIKILSDNDIVNKNIPLVNFSWHIKNEIKKYMNLKKYKGKIININ